MLIFSLICLMAFSAANAAYSSTSSGSRSPSRYANRYGYDAYAPTYGYTGGFAGGNGGFASAGGFAGSGAGGFVGGFDPFAFVFGSNNDGAFTGTNVYTSDDAYANAEASLLPDEDPVASIHAQNLNFHDHLTASILAQNAYLANQAAAAGSYGNRRRPAGYASYAGGSASIGPNGIHHTSFVYPSNSHSPNVDTRIGSSSSGNRKGPGFYGISSSSYSANVGGKQQGGSLTTVNDNGKVTAYRTHS